MATLPTRPPIPDSFLCPITQQVMANPVQAADGFTYEAHAITHWLAQPRGRNRASGLPLAPRSPMTNLALPHDQLTENRALKSAIEAWFEHYPDMRLEVPNMEVRDVLVAVEGLQGDKGGFVDQLRGKVRELETQLEGRDKSLAEKEMELAKVRRELKQKTKTCASIRDLLNGQAADSSTGRPHSTGSGSDEEDVIVDGPALTKEVNPETLQHIIEMGGKHGAEIEKGDFHYIVDTISIDLELLIESTKAMNTRSGKVGKMIFSCSDDDWSAVAYCPKDKSAVCNAREWLSEVVVKVANAAYLSEIKTFDGIDEACWAAICIEKDFEQNLCPIRMHDTAIDHAYIFLEKKGLW